MDRFKPKSINNSPNRLVKKQLKNLNNNNNIDFMSNIQHNNNHHKQNHASPRKILENNDFGIPSVERQFSKLENYNNTNSGSSHFSKTKEKFATSKSYIPEEDVQQDNHTSDRKIRQPRLSSMQNHQNFIEDLQPQHDQNALLETDVKQLKSDSSNYKLREKSPFNITSNQKVQTKPFNGIVTKHKITNSDNINNINFSNCRIVEPIDTRERFYSSNYKQECKGSVVNSAVSKNMHNNHDFVK